MENRYSKSEEMWNAITHGIGVVFGIVALTILLVLSIQKKDITAIISFSIYGISIILMFLSSTLYHSITNEKAKKILRVFDHSSIFLFIAGTYTPVLMLTLTGKLKIVLIVMMWILALAGVIFKLFTFGKFDKYKSLSVILYIVMGWIGIFPIKKIISATSIKFFYWILAGGLLYSFGTIFYRDAKIPYNHAIWHFFVLGASVMHFLGILFYLA